MQVSGDLVGGWTERVPMTRCTNPDGCLGASKGGCEVDSNDEAACMSFDYTLIGTQQQQLDNYVYALCYCDAYLIRQ